MAPQEKRAEHDRKLDVGARLNRQFLSATEREPGAITAAAVSFLVGLGSSIGIVGLASLGQFTYAVARRPPTLSP